jgi:MFS family permease
VIEKMVDKDRKEVKSKLKLNALGHSYNDVYFFIIPLLLPLFREEFQLNYFQSGLILTIHVALRSIFSLIFGYVGDQCDKRVVIASGFICSSIFLGGLIWINNIHTITAFLFLLAIGVSTFHPLATAMVRENSKASQRGRYLSLFSAAGTAGIIIRYLCSNMEMENYLLTILFTWLFPGLCLPKIKKG